MLIEKKPIRIREHSEYWSIMKIASWSSLHGQSFGKQNWLFQLNWICIFFLYYFKIELKIFRDRRLYDSLQFNEHHKTFSKLLFQYNIIKWKFSSNYKQHFCSWQIWSRCFSSKNAATNFVWDDEEKRKMKKNRSLYSKKMNITYVFLGIRPLVCRLIVFLSHEKSETNE